MFSQSMLLKMPNKSLVSLIHLHLISILLDTMADLPDV